MSHTYLLTSVFVLATAAANLLQKKAMQGFSVDHLGDLLLSPYLWGGLSCYAVSLVMYLLILARVPLNVATSIASLNFVAVLLASRLILGEPLPPLRIVGFMCILIGMSIVAYTQHART